MGGRNGITGLRPASALGRVLADSDGTVDPPPGQSATPLTYTRPDVAPAQLQRRDLASHIQQTLLEAGVGPCVVDPFTAACAAPRTTRTRPLASVIPVQLLLLTSQQAPLSQSARRLVQHLRDAAAESLGQKAAT